VSDQLIVEREGLEKKDKSELQTIVAALGGTATTRMRKSELIDMILDLSGATARADQAAPDDEADIENPADDDAATADTSDDSAESRSDTADDSTGRAESRSDTADDSTGRAESRSDTADDSTGRADDPTGGAANGTAEERPEQKAEVTTKSARDRRQGGRTQGSSRRSSSKHPVGPDGEPLADWEIQVLEESDGDSPGRARAGNDRNQRGRNRNGGSDGGGRSTGGRSNPKDNRSDTKQGGNQQNKQDSKQNGKNNDDETEQGNRRQRRRNRGRGRDDAGDDAVSDESISVEGYLDLRDEGYAFLRVNGFLPSKDDAYVSVKQVRQYKLRKGDHVVGRSRPANRNEKNPALHEIDSINGKSPGDVTPRPDFEELTPLFPDERLVLEMKDEPLNMTVRIVDLFAPIGKGQRGLIVSPPKAGKTAIMKNIARAIETNNPEVELLVLLVDERPEEVTDMKRSLGNGEVVSSTFDRPPEEHTAIAELTLERAKRMAEDGRDVCLIIDGITRLARAYNMAGPQSGKALSGGIDAAALYPPKRFLGAARNFEEGGSLTILATALVETGSKMDEVIFEECKGTGNMELRLDRRLAEKRIFPAIDIDGSSTRNEELLRPKKQVEASWKLRRVIAGMGGEGDSRNAAGIEMLIERLATFKTNEEFLAEIAKAGSV
jgi:transcription termination factor Rho